MYVLVILKYEMAKTIQQGLLVRNIKLQGLTFKAVCFQLVLCNKDYTIMRPLIMRVTEHSCVA